MADGVVKIPRQGGCCKCHAGLAALGLLAQTRAETIADSFGKKKPDEGCAAFFSSRIIGT